MDNVVIIFVGLLLACVSAASLNKDLIGSVPRLTDNRIVGGSPCTEYQYPHQVGLRYKSIFGPEKPFSHFCGGSIYSESIVITAAHCIISRVASEFKIVAGTRYRQSNDGYIVPVKEIIMHKKYDPARYDNDIALMVLGAPLPLNNLTMKAIELATEDPKAGATATVTGWGTTSSGGSDPDILQKVQVPIVSRELCNEDYSGQITNSMICAGIRGVGGKDACQGDSGGPLVVNGKLTGIVSWGFGCADPEFPGVYASVPYLSSWISEQVKMIYQRNKSFQ